VRLKQQQQQKSNKYLGSRIFRAPEILMGSNEITKSIDIWSAGLILLSILSGCYPLFEDFPNESEEQASFNILSQIMVLRGIDKIMRLANSMEKRLDTNIHCEEVLLKDFCIRCRNGDSLDLIQIPSVYDLLENCLQVEPRDRILAQQIDTHPFFEDK